MKVTDLAPDKGGDFTSYELGSENGYVNIELKGNPLLVEEE